MVVKLRTDGWLTLQYLPKSHTRPSVQSLTSFEQLHITCYPKKSKRGFKKGDPLTHIVIVLTGRQVVVHFITS